MLHNVFHQQPCSHVAQGWTPLHQLSRDQHAAEITSMLLKLLLEAGADINAKDVQVKVASPLNVICLFICHGSSDYMQSDACTLHTVNADAACVHSCL